LNVIRGHKGFFAAQKPDAVANCSKPKLITLVT